MGVTGARATTSDLAGPLVARTRAVTDLPVGVGLGVSNGDQAAEVAAYADGGDRRLGVRPRACSTTTTGAPALDGADRAHRGPRRGRTPWRRPARAARCSRCCWPRWRGCAGERQAERRFTGAVLDQPYHVPTTTLTDTDGQPYSLADEHRQAAHPGLLRLHPLPRHLPDRDGHPGLGR